MTETKSYYAVIPANVRYDESLPPNAKLLYGEITALCNSEGYCWASNKYFAELYEVSHKTISRWINALVAKGYISSKIIYKEGTKQIDKRYIAIISDPIDKNVQGYRQKCHDPMDKNVHTPMDKNVIDNNTYINTTFNNTFEYMSAPDKVGHKPTKQTRFIPPTLEQVRNYCNERNNNVDAERFIDHYTANGWLVGKNKMKDWRAAVRTWEKNSFSKQGPSGTTGNIFLDLIKEGALDD